MRSFSTALNLIPACLGAAVTLVASQALAQAPAQAPGFDGAQVTLRRPQLGVAGLGCPVFMRASQRSVAQQFEAGGTVPARPAQGLTVTLTGLRSLRITSAEVVAHALSPKRRAVLTSSEDDADVERPFHLVAKESREFHGDLWMEGVTAIRWIEVRSLTYSNGRVWRDSDTQKCIVKPEPFVLISAGH